MPFSIFPSTYRDAAPEVTSETYEKLEVDLPSKQQAGREGQYSSFTATAELPPRGDHRYSEEEVRITREEERYRRPGFEQQVHDHR